MKKFQVYIEATVEVEEITDEEPVHPIEPPIQPPVEPPVEPPISPGVPPAIHPPGDDIREILEMYPDKGGVVTVAAGEYRGGGAGVFPHAKPLVVLAEHPGQVMVNCAAADLTMDYGSTNIFLAGLKHKSGTIMDNGDNITFWYHDGTFPIEEWNAMYLAAGGGRDKTDAQKKAAIQRMTHPVCKGIWIGQNAQGHQLKNNWLYGCDIHDCGDDGVFFDKTSGGTDGHRIWNVEEKAYDPGVNPWAPGDLFHNDAVQTPGAVDLRIGYGYLQQVCNLGGDNASCKLLLEDLWIAGSGAAGFLVISSRNGIYTELSMKKVVGWSNGMSFQNDEAWNTMMTQYCDERRILVWGTQDVTSATGGTVGSGRFNVPGRFVTRDLGGNSDRVSPGGFAMTGPGDMYMVDKLAPLNDPRNPALLWRQRNPYESWRNFVAA